MSQKDKNEFYEEYKEISPFWSWVFVISHIVFLLGFSITLMLNIPDVPREWNFGTEDFTPAKSVFTSNDPKNKTPEEPLIELLPESVPLEKAEEIMKLKKMAE